MSTPSTQWREQIAPDEEARFARQAEMLRAVHAAKSARFGRGRLLHRKAIVGLRGTFEVLDGLSPFARYGVFAQPAIYTAIARLSNGGLDIASNTAPDIRGFALKIEGIHGASSLGGETDHQDFLLVNHEHFAARTSDEFVATVHTIAKGKLVWLLQTLRTFGLRDGLARVQAALAMLKKPFSGFAKEPFNTVVPFAVGPYAARMRLTPVAPGAARGDFETDMRERVQQGPVAYDVALQFFVDESSTPIENPTVVWPESASPYVTVARLTLTSIEPDVEGLRFDPWGGLADHRPLGEIMRARKSAYFLSQQGRLG